MVELINATGEDLAPTTSYVFGVPDDPHCDAVEWVQPDDEMKMKNSDQALVKPIPHLYQSFPVREYVDHDDLVEGISGLFEEIDEVNDMIGLSTNVVSHKLPINSEFSPVKQKARKFKPKLSLKIQDEITKQIESLLVKMTQYPTWLSIVVSVAKKYGKIRIFVDYRDFNKVRPEDNFPLPNIHILIDNYSKHEMQSFVDCYIGYHQILMDEEDAKKTTFITPWGVYHYKVIPFGLKNVGATYMRDMTTIFHDMIHKEIEVYVDGIIIKSRESSDHLTHFRKFFDHLRRYNLKLNPAKRVFGVPNGKLYGLIVSRRGIELDPFKIKVSECFRCYQELSVQSTGVGSSVRRESLLQYLSVLDNADGCVLDQHDETWKKERDGPIEVYFFQKAIPTRKLAKWKMLLSEFDIVYVTQKAIKAQALADHLAENLVDEEYEPLKTYFPDEKVQGEWVVEKPKIMPYVQYIRKLCKRFPKIEFRHTPIIHNELDDDPATIATMIKHPDADYIDPMDIKIKEKAVYCSYVEEEPNGLPWYLDIKKYLESETYPENATSNKKKSIIRLALNFFLSGEVIYRRTPDLSLLRCIDVVEVAKLIEQIHARVYGKHMNGLTLARKILQAGYFLDDYEA
ncbi:uncharacterized protein LOC107003924 [Solanum pennellii]|uniref:Uncharacterized protein LOC107003924 n=1 Tax=Solanum pennellii TaxID=28526 RepID=A0ABM1FJ58_SOLPN|nr:uncharacterized protein LOC107003924 [Solanum pennellii]